MTIKELESKIELLNERINLLSDIIEHAGNIIKQQLPSIENELAALGEYWINAETKLADPINLDKKVRVDNE